MEMHRISLVLASLTILALAPLAVVADTSTATVKLNAQNGSGENGTATLTQDGSDVKVVITLTGAPAAEQPAHIHDGTCADLKGVAYPLTSLTNGSSTTVVKDVSIAKLTGGTYAINVHQSTSDLGKYVACGEIAAK
jgi:Cu/Zn superoxide dismutase